MGRAGESEGGNWDNCNRTIVKKNKTIGRTQPLLTPPLNYAVHALRSCWQKMLMIKWIQYHFLIECIFYRSQALHTFPKISIHTWERPILSRSEDTEGITDLSQGFGIGTEVRKPLPRACALLQDLLFSYPKCKAPGQEGSRVLIMFPNSLQSGGLPKDEEGSQLFWD